MRKPIKYGLLGPGRPGGPRASAAVAVFALTFDPNRYKGQIEAAVKEKTGRTLKLAGKLELAFWPSLGAKVAGVSLSEKGSEREFVSLESAHASIAVLPLLHGAVLVDGIRVAGLKANVVKDKQGKFNFSDLMEAPEKPAAGAKPAEPAKGAVGFDIGSVRIERSSVSYRDLASGQELSLADIDLSTGRIAEQADGKLKFSVQAKGRNPDLDAKLQLAADYQVDLPAKSYALSGVDGKVTGTVAKEALEAKLSAPRIAIAADSAKGEAVTLEAKLGARQVSLKIAGIEGSAKALVDPEARGAGVDADARSAAEDAAGSMSTGSLRGRSREAVGERRSDGQGRRVDHPGEARAAEVLAAGVQLRRQHRQAERRPLHAREGRRQSRAAKAGPAGRGRKRRSTSPRSRASTRTASCRSARCRCAGLKLANVKAEVKAANGRADVSPHSASLYEGKVAGALSLQADGNRITLKEDLSGVAIGPLLKDVAQKDLLEGSGNVALDVNAAGPTVEAMKKALAGTARAAAEGRRDQGLQSRGGAAQGESGARLEGGSRPPPTRRRRPTSAR